MWQYHLLGELHPAVHIGICGAHFLPCSYRLANWPIWPDQKEHLILHCKCFNRQSRINGSGGLLKLSNRITCEGYVNLIVCVLCVIYFYVCVSYSGNSISIISYTFSSSSGVFCQDMIDSCAKAILSDVCFVFGHHSIGISDLCLRWTHT